MLGAILGDIAGSEYEFNENRTYPKELFTDKDFITDDTILTMALVNTLHNAKVLKEMSDDKLKYNYRRAVVNAVKMNPQADWGLHFKQWAEKAYTNNGLPANKSKGNGCAMKISPVALFSKSMKECKHLAHLFTSVTHDHPEAYKAAECVATSIYLALQNESKKEIRRNIEKYYDIDFGSYEKLNKEYQYSELAEESVPQALFLFLESKDFEDCLKKCVSIGGDADTIAAIAGPLAEAYYNVSRDAYRSVLERYMGVQYVGRLDKFYEEDCNK